MNQAGAYRLTGRPSSTAARQGEKRARQPAEDYGLSPTRKKKQQARAGGGPSLLFVGNKGGQGETRLMSKNSTTPRDACQARLLRLLPENPLEVR
jgi:hypothetical protein